MLIEKNEKYNRYLDILKKSFEEKKFYEFINDLLNIEIKDLEKNVKNKPTTSQYIEYIEYSSLYAKYNDNNDYIGVLIIKVKENKKVQNARTLQRNYISHLMDYYGLQGSIAAIYSDGDEMWRLSFVKKEEEIILGKLKRKFTPAKRYSYLFGENEPNHTAETQLLTLLNNNAKKFSLNELEEVFSVEKVTTEFFSKYKEKYLELLKNLNQNEEFVEESKRCQFTSEEFAKKLMGQIVFLYFLQKKGWLGVKLVPDKINNNDYMDIYKNKNMQERKVLDKYYINYNGEKKLKTTLVSKIEENKEEIRILSSIFIDTKYDKEWGSGSKKFIREIFNAYQRKTTKNNCFFDDYLEPLFYSALNEKRDNQYFGILNCKIPFLNGGLFEPLENYEWKLANFGIPDEIFAEILDFFDQYNFTINEEEPLEKEVAVDPEMLGKIFEELLDVNERKNTGSFYTPRNIVHYMCQESIINYLSNNIEISEEEIADFIKNGEYYRDNDLKENNPEKYSIPKAIFDNIHRIDTALKNVKIADPAAGSGAFPLGMLNEIVKIRDIITSYMIIYNKLGKYEKKYDNTLIYEKRKIYDIKLNTIENCIYAVDLENSAVEIAKLRLWLSIVVDQDHVDKSGPEPLPNLDCKIMQGNSLVDSYEGTKLFNEELISESITIKNKADRKLQMSFFGNSNEAQMEFYVDEKVELISKLIEAKKKIFKLENHDEKRFILEKINDYRRSLMMTQFRNNKNIEALFNEDKSHSKSFFSWALEFIEVFSENGGFDIVIGNPPYIQLQKKVEENSNIHFADLYDKLNYKTFKRTGDIYCLFYELGINLLRKNGNLCFITSNKWMRAGYGEVLRDFLKDYNPKTIIDFPGIKVFESATVDVNILQVEKKSNVGKTMACLMTQDGYRKMSDYIKHSKNEVKFNTSDNWVILNPIELSIKEKIEKYGKPLSKWNVSINYGIKTGFNDAFIIDEDTKNKLINENNNSADLIRPILRGRDIGRYKCTFQKLWLIYLPWHFPLTNSQTIIGASEEAEKQFANQYPAIYEHMLKYKEKLSSRNQAETGIRYEWYALQRYGSNYSDDFNKPKIMYSEIVQAPRFYFDEKGFYYPEATTFILTGDKLPYIYCLLNSSVMFYIFSTFYAGGGLGDKGIRYKKNFLINLPLPQCNDLKWFEELIDKYSNKVLSIESLDNMVCNYVYSAFKFTEDEITFIKSKKSGI